jgi:hypothetical protein
MVKTHPRAQAHRGELVPSTKYFIEREVGEEEMVVVISPREKA